TFERGKLASAQATVGPATPSTPIVAVQDSGTKLASILTGALGLSAALQMAAAYLKASKRCCPTVVPALPPTGGAAVGSLNPSFALFLFTIAIAAAACECLGAPNAIAVAIAKDQAPIGLLFFKRIPRAAGEEFSRPVE